jgi:ubiquinone/menaquinone biosynthesis C-methylase UbiE
MHVDRVILAAVLGEIPDRDSALREVAGLLRPGGMLSITELVFDPHYQPRATVLELAQAAGFREMAFFGSRLAYTLNLTRRDREQPRLSRSRRRVKKPAILAIPPRRGNI